MSADRVAASAEAPPPFPVLLLPRRSGSGGWFSVSVLCPLSALLLTPVRSVL